MKHLTGWQRLFVVLSAAWLVGAILFLANVPFPRVAPIDAKFRSLLEPSTTEILPVDQYPIFRGTEDRTVVSMPNGQRLSFSVADHDRLTAAVKDYERVHETELARLRRNDLWYRVLFVVLPPIFLFAVGWSVGWIYRGFRPS